jgi:2-beta-glucuronyltransferase
VRRALAAPRVRSRRPLDWAQTVDRLLDPAAFPDTRIAAARMWHAG